MSTELKPCPFCGNKASFDRVGNRQQSTIVSCDDCGCSLENGEEWNHGRGWNNRPAEDALTARIAEQDARIAKLEKYALEITRVLTGLAGGGSELFDGKIGELYTADLPFCSGKIRDKHTKLHELLVAERRKTLRLSRAILSEGEGA